jgi:hypothetical protein
MQLAAMSRAASDVATFTAISHTKAPTGLPHPAHSFPDDAPSFYSLVVQTVRFGLVV